MTVKPIKLVIPYIRYIKELLKRPFSFSGNERPAVIPHLPTTIQQSALPLVSKGPGGIGNYTQYEIFEEDICAPPRSPRRSRGVTGRDALIPLNAGLENKPRKGIKFISPQIGRLKNLLSRCTGVHPLVYLF